MSLSKPLSISSKSFLFNCNRPQIEKGLDKLCVKLHQLYTGNNSSISINLRDFERQAHLLLNNVLASFEDNKTVYETRLAPTFYENRYGFRQDELNKSKFAEYHQLPRMNSLSYGHRLLNNNPSTYQQIRGFKTKRQLSDRSNESNFADMLKNRFVDPFEKSSPATSTRLGSIFKGTGNRSPTPIENLNSGSTDDMIKKAFAEGILYADGKKQKTSAGRFLFIFFITMLLITTGVSLLNEKLTKDSGKSGAGGINIRSLTGTVNYEVDPENVTTKFDDVKGMPEAKQELLEVVDFLREPEKYTRLGARLPKGVLLVGPPGCGKTLLAKSVAGEAGVPFFQASGSDFDEMFVGTGSKRVRSLFQAARAKAPCVIFIDEIDSVGSTRTNSAVHPHANQTINQLLAEMDGFQRNEGVIVIGATNRRETLDPALLRPGRFDVEVKIDKPDLKMRIEILEYYLAKVAADPKIDVKYLAKQLNGLGGSSIENVVNQGALRAVVQGSNTVKMEHLEYALDKQIMGHGKGRLVNELTNKNTAYHEAGHVLVAYYTKGSHPLHKVTILPRAKSLGHTAFVPEDDIYSRTKSQLLAQMDVAMGGRVAEELIFGKDEVTTGASGDFQTATAIAQTMVKYYGMNESVGIRYLEDKKGELSEHTQEILDQEIKKYLEESYKRAKHILNTHSRELKLLAEALLDKETLDADQIKKIIEQ